MKRKLKKYLVSVEFTDQLDEEIYARSKKEALEKFYEEHYIDGYVSDENVSDENVEELE